MIIVPGNNLAADPHFRWIVGNWETDLTTGCGGMDSPVRQSQPGWFGMNCQFLGPGEVDG